MELKGILSISGKSGLFKLVSQTKNSIIVESLDDKKRMPAFSSSKISALEDIAIYTETGDVPLADVLKRIYEYEKGNVSVDAKESSAVLQKRFEAVLPEYDKNRVYISDIKRVFAWYNQLHKHNYLVFEEKTEAAEAK